MSEQLPNSSDRGMDDVLSLCAVLRLDSQGVQRPWYEVFDELVEALEWLDSKERDWCLRIMFRGCERG